MKKLIITLISLSLLCCQAPVDEIPADCTTENDQIRIDTLPTSIFFIKNKALNHYTANYTNQEATSFTLKSSIDLDQGGDEFQTNTPVIRRNRLGGINYDMYISQHKKVYKFNIDEPNDLELTQVWEFDTVDEIFNDPFIMRAGFSGDAVFIANDDGEVYCLDADNGNEIWKYKIDSGAKIRSSITGIIYRNSVLGDNPMIFFGADDGYIYALSAFHGTLLWKFDTGALIRSSPLLYPYKTSGQGTDNSGNGFGDIDNPGSIIVGNHDGQVYGLNSWTGELQWQHFNGNGAIFGAPTYFNFNNKFYITNIDQQLITCYNTNGTVDWVFQATGRIATTPFCVRYNGGMRVLFTTENGSLYALNGSGGLEWESNIKLGEFTNRSSPVSAFKNLIYLNTPSHLLGIKIEDGSIKHQLETDGSGNGTPTLLYGTEDCFDDIQSLFPQHSGVVGNQNNDNEII